MGNIDKRDLVIGEKSESDENKSVSFRLDAESKLLMNTEAIRKVVMKLIAFKKAKKLGKLKVVQSNNSVDVTLEV